MDGWLAVVVVVMVQPTDATELRSAQLRFQGSTVVR